MAPKSGSVLNEPRSAVEIAESIKSCRDLIRVADVQIDKAKSDLSIARLGLAEVELELTTRGLRSSDPGSNGQEAGGLGVRRARPASSVHRAILAAVAMNLALNAAPARAALVLDVDALLERLPAQVRANLAWTKAPIATQLRRLQSEAVTDALLDEVTRAIAAPLQTLGRTFLEFMAANQDVLRAAVMDDIGRDQRRVQSYIDDADAVDTAEWAFGFLRSFFNATLPLLELVVPTELENAIHHGLEDSRMADLLRGQIALMGAIEAVKSEAPREKVVELVEVAFLRLMRARDHFRQVGFWVSPFPEETTEQRRQDTLRYAQRLREVLTDDDWATFGQARFGDLR